MSENNYCKETHILQSQTDRPQNDLETCFKIGILKSLHKQKLLTEGQLKACIRLLIEKTGKKPAG